MKPNSLNGEHSAEDFAAYRKKAKSELEKRRFHAMELLAAGFGRRRIVNSLGLGRNTLGSWIAKVNKGGPEALLTTPGQGAHHKLDKTQINELIREVLAYPDGNDARQTEWDAKKIALFIHAKFNVSCSQSTVYNILKNAGISKLKANKIREKKTAAKQLANRQWTGPRRREA